MSSPLSSSPSRFSSRPVWPRPSSIAQRNSQSSVNSPRATTPHSVLGGSLSSQIYTTKEPITTDDGTRQWSVCALEWVVRRVEYLREFAEASGDSDAPEDMEAMYFSPVLDGKFKLELARTTSELGTNTLSLFITSLLIDFAHDKFGMSTTMMVAIKPEDGPGERARTEWQFEAWQQAFTFSRGSEVWECPLPTISHLLQNDTIRETDSFVICLQIHSPMGPFFPAQPSAYYVPRELLEGLEALLDNPNTGDVQFVCLERLDTHSISEPPSPLECHETRRPSSSTSVVSPFSSQTTARKRVIYAHTDILKRRSEHFQIMFNSSFVENSSVRTNERNIRTVIVDEADYETMYWFLKWVYANWLSFKPIEDPRIAVEGVGTGWHSKWNRIQGGEWDWKTFSKHGGNDATRDGSRSATTNESPGEPQITKTEPSNVSASPARTTKPTITSRPPQPSTTMSSTRRPPAVAPQLALATSLSPKTNAGKVLPPTSHQSATHYPMSPRTPRHPTTPDPHSHPAPPCQPASALAMYQLAHRYTIPGLASLALEHLMSTITPQSSFALLLASSVWDELRSLVEDYVVEKWDEVSRSDEFEQCCEEVAAGEWGVEGSRTLVAVFRRLRSPTATI